MIKNFVFKTAKRLIKTNAIGEQCIRNGDGVPTLGDEDRKKYLGKNIMRSF